MPRTKPLQNTRVMTAPQLALKPPQAATASKPASRQERVQARIIAAGLGLFSRKGFDSTTITEIADAAEISRRSFFRYFQSKEDVVFDWLIKQGDCIAESLKERSPGIHPLVAIRTAMITLAIRQDADRSRALLMTRIAFETESLNRRYSAENARWEHNLLDIVRAEGAMEPQHDFALRVQISATTTAFLIAIRAWATSDPDGYLQRWVEAAFEALAVDCSTGKGPRSSQAGTRRRSPQ